MMVEKESVYICEDHPLYSEALASLIKNSDRFELAGVSNNGIDAITEIGRTDPDIVLLDLNIPGLDGFEILERLNQSSVKRKIVVLTSYNDKDLIAKAKRLGASGYVIKQTQGKKLLQLLEDLDHNRFVELVPKSGNQMTTEDKRSSATLKLTNQEKKILKELTTGASVSELSERLFISENTVKNHKKSIYRKLGVGSHAELILFCTEHGLLD